MSVFVQQHDVYHSTRHIAEGAWQYRTAQLHGSFRGGGRMPLLLLGVDPTRVVIVHDMLAHVAAIPSTADGESAQRPHDARPERPVVKPMGGGGAPTNAV